MGAEEGTGAAVGVDALPVPAGAPVGAKTPGAVAEGAEAEDEAGLEPELPEPELPEPEPLEDPLPLAGTRRAAEPDGQVGAWRP